MQSMNYKASVKKKKFLNSVWIKMTLSDGNVKNETKN